MGFVIGCDLGSQSVKAVLLDSDGNVVATAAEPHRMEHPRSGWAEQDPAVYCSGLRSTVQRVLRDSQVEPRDVTHIALSSQVDGVVPIDARNAPLRSAIIWLDCRATEQMARFAEAAGDERCFSRTGLNLNATHTAAKIMWLAEHEPDIYRAAACLPSVGGYALAWLVGVPIQDHAHSSATLLYDLTDRCWSDEFAAAAGIDIGKLPRIGRAEDVAGILRPEVASELGLSRDCMVVIGTGDDQAACLGAGGVRPGIVVDMSGTAEPVGVTSTIPVFDVTRLVETHAHAVGGRYLIENPGFVSGGNTLWFAHVLGVSQLEFFELAERSRPGAGGVRFIPALSGATAPRWNNNMRATFSGLGMNHDSADLARAVVEANAFAFRDVYDRLCELGLADSVRAVGGGSRSDLWLRTKATVCGTPISRVATCDSSAMGAGLLAAVAAGTFRDLIEATDAVVELDPVVVEPEPDSLEQLEAAYQDYRTLFDTLEPIA